MKKGKLLNAAVLVFLLITPNGLLAESDTELFRETYRKAEAGNAEAQFNLGEMYYNGEGVSQNDKEALKWYLKAAEQGHAGAQYTLGFMYYNGEGVSQNDKEATNWFSRAARHGHAKAQRILAICYAKGKGVPKDYKKAFKLFSEAADQGDVGAQACLGWMYGKGLGVTQNYKEAANWFFKAAEQGDDGAQSMLGNIYYEGKGIPQDYKEAIKWFSKAAEQGYADAQYRLGWMHEKGEGVPQNNIEAYKWYNLAAAQGDENAKEARDILRKKISPNHIIEAQRLSREFRPRAADVVAVPESAKVASTEKPGVQADKVPGEMKGGKSTSKAAVDAFVDVDINIPKGKKKQPEGIAVIIGNGHYSRYGNGISDVTYAARDAAYMKKYVVDTLGFDEKNVIYEQDVTQGSLATIFGTANNYRGKLYNYVKAGKSDVFVYYTGHGAPDPAGKGAFLVPVDANVDYIASNGYPLDTFYKNLSKVREKIGSGRMTVILDACFSGDSGGGVLFRNISPAMIKTASPVGNLEEAVIFTSAGESEVSQWYPDKRHSLFTYFFMKGLRGDADRNKNKTITVGEMRDYLKDNVPYLARRLGGREQNPVIVGEESLELVSFR